MDQSKWVRRLHDASDFLGGFITGVVLCIVVAGGACFVAEAITGTTFSWFWEVLVVPCLFFVLGIVGYMACTLAAVILTRKGDW